MPKPGNLKFTGVQEFEKGKRTQLSDHFYSDELDCNCTNLECKITKIDMDLIQCLELYRAQRGKSIKIRSGYRCLKHNILSGGSTSSKHLTGEAADFETDLSLYELLLTAHIFNGVGDGRHKGFLHGDVRKVDKFTFWEYPK